MSAQVCSYVNMLSEELVSADDMSEDPNPQISTLGKLLIMYQRILEANNYMDFSSIQVETYNLLVSHPEILNELQNKIITATTSKKKSIKWRKRKKWTNR